MVDLQIARLEDTAANATLAAISLHEEFFELLGKRRPSSLVDAARRCRIAKTVRGNRSPIFALDRESLDRNA